MHLSAVESCSNLNYLHNQSRFPDNEHSCQCLGSEYELCVICALKFCFCSLKNMLRLCMMFTSIHSDCYASPECCYFVMDVPSPVFVGVPRPTNYHLLEKKNVAVLLYMYTELEGFGESHIKHWQIYQSPTPKCYSHMVQGLACFVYLQICLMLLPCQLHAIFGSLVLLSMCPWWLGTLSKRCFDC